MSILACPVCHNFPLKLTILKWLPIVSKNKETGKKEEKDAPTDLLERYEAKVVLPPKTSSPIQWHLNEEGIPLISDFLVLEPSPIPVYIQKIWDLLSELEWIQDKSGKEGNTLLSLIKDSVLPKIKDSKEKIDALNKNDKDKDYSLMKEKIMDILLDLEFINMYYYTMEIEDALIQCSGCGRWFPVFETIPQMLPDNIRNKEEDENFRKKWKNVISF